MNLSGTLEVIKAHYDELTITQIIEDDAKLSLYFRTAEDGRRMLSNVFITNDDEVDNDDDF